jgi:Zn finger protein HypA/HybF involved in hydrogenase expression
MFDKPSEQEEEYIARMEFERKKRIESEKHIKLAQEEKKKLKDLHFMRCPKCGMELIEIDYKGTKVDECSECRGVWLDAGELSAVSRFEKSTLDKFFSIFQKQEE